MKYPQQSKLIQIISPSNGIRKEKIDDLEQAERFLINKGYKIIEDKYVRNSLNGESTNAINRSKELNKFLNDPKPKILIACTGGDYLIEILENINVNLKSIKWIQGASDITPLLYYITTRFDVATIYSFNVKDYGSKSVPGSMLENSIQILKGDLVVQRNYSEWNNLMPFGIIKGRIIGGCLESLKDIIGTNFDYTKAFINRYKKDGIIWFFDIAYMSNEDIMRTLWQFKNAGWFLHCNGILFGKLYEEKSYTNLDFKSAIKRGLKGMNIPIILNCDIGHVKPVITIVNGSLVKIEYSDSYYFKTYME